MGAQEKDPRDVPSTPHKEKAEILAREWHREFDLNLVDINMGVMLEYWLTYRFIGIYEHGR